MELDAQKKRAINFSSDERRILVELVLKYRESIENRCTDATSNSAKMKGWIRLAEEFNTISTYCHRKHPELKRCWENIKRQTKKDCAARKKNIFMTGGGKPPSPPPTIQGSGAVVENITDSWSSWTPKNLKTPCSSQLKSKRNEEDWLTRRRPKQDCLSDTLSKEKIKLVQLLQENAEKESQIRLAILEEQLKQEKLKTKKLMDNQ
ncbi:hypothetical protein ABMA28_012750 [Loxostege sticticalis]|uniref:Regulatory protein zeste n=1 Tax=Loxostege sticticalis TaxID=481309 RepID=A0ABD0S4X7_LOXSC